MALRRAHKCELSLGFTGRRQALRRLLSQPAGLRAVHSVPIESVFPFDSSEPENILTAGYFWTGGHWQEKAPSRRPEDDLTIFVC